MSGCAETEAYSNFFYSSVAFFQTLLILASLALWQLVLSALPCRRTPLGRLLTRIAARPFLQILLPLGSIARPNEVHFRPSGQACHLPKRVRPTSWITRLRLLVWFSCPYLVWAAPSGVPGPSEGFGPH